MVSGTEEENALVFGRESIRSGYPGDSGNQLMATGASVSFAAKHRKIAAFSSEETVSDAELSVWHVEGTVASTDSKPGQLVGSIGLATQKAGCLSFS